MLEPESAISWQRVGDVTIVRLEIDALRETLAVRRAADELRALAEEVGGKMVFSLANVKLISSSGLSALIEFKRRLRSVNGQLKMCDLQPMVLHLFMSFGLDQAFELHPSTREAMDAFHHDRPDGACAPM